MKRSKWLCLHGDKVDLIPPSLDCHGGISRSISVLFRCHRNASHDLSFATHSLSMAPTKKNKYSVILPTYNERQNLPILVQMLHDVFTKE
jgi:hypothetical protein